MLKVIIADNEPALRLEISKILEDIGGIGEVREVSDGKQLVQMVEEHKPDVIFLNAEMPVMNGIQAAKEIFNIDPKISLVFISTVDSYAYEAFKVYAMDYLLKPLNALRIRQTIRRIKDIKMEITYSMMAQCPVAAEAKYNHLCIQTIEGLKFIHPRDIILITRKDRKTAIHTTQGTILTNEPLQRMKVRLKSDRFFRCHKGYIVNAEMVREIIPWGAKTYLVKLLKTTETALMTLEKVKEFKYIYAY